jgi:hypothetical protein
MSTSFRDQQEARRQRGLNQRLYLLDEGVLHEDEIIQYDVMGNSGKPYDIMMAKSNMASVEHRMDHMFTCSCPDYRNRHVTCKHIYFIKERVLQGLDRQADRWKLALKRISTKTKDYYQPQEDNEKKRRSWVGEQCSICIEEMKDSEQVTWCKTCGNSVHEECYGYWKMVRPTCPNCRAKNLGR